ncbi:MAG: hypothetical protein AAGF07_04730 [Patescibacteria group bacterium]
MKINLKPNLFQQTTFLQILSLTLLSTGLFVNTINVDAKNLINLPNPHGYVDSYNPETQTIEGWTCNMIDKSKRSFENFRVENKTSENSKTNIHYSDIEIVYREDVKKTFKPCSAETGWRLKLEKLDDIIKVGDNSLNFYMIGRGNDGFIDIPLGGLNPLVVNLAPDSEATTGFIENIQDNSLVGWACDPDTTRPITVRFEAVDELNNVYSLGSVGEEDYYNRLDIVENTNCGKGNYGFKFKIPRRVSKRTCTKYGFPMLCKRATFDLPANLPISAFTMHTYHPRDVKMRRYYSLSDYSLETTGTAISTPMIDSTGLGEVVECTKYSKVVDFGECAVRGL